MEGSSFRVGDKVLYHAGHMDERPPLKKGVIIQIVEKHGTIFTHSNSYLNDY